VRRLRCLSCGNADPATLGYFELEGDGGRRVDYCEKCRRYVKTVDLRATSGESGPARRDLEDLSSAELDLAAAREGFIPLAADGAAAEWRRTGLGSDRTRGGLS
jgi:FdhE protein